jgi:hypothetical protein
MPHDQDFTASHQHNGSSDGFHQHTPVFLVADEII